jgi:hypothetical protein
MEPGRRWVHIQLREIVNDVNEDFADVEHVCLGEAGGPGTLVVVAAHGGNRSELSKLVNYVGVTDVASVNDEVATAKSVQRLGAEQSMGVGDQPYAESTTRHGPTSHLTNASGRPNGVWHGITASGPNKRFATGLDASSLSMASAIHPIATWLPFAQCRSCSGIATSPRR